MKLCELLACIYINAEHFSSPHKEKVGEAGIFQAKKLLTYEAVTAGNSLGPCRLWTEVCLSEAEKL